MVISPQKAKPVESGQGFASPTPTSLRRGACQRLVAAASNRVVQLVCFRVNTVATARPHETRQSTNIEATSRVT
eukprot:COSAG02_NODE_661_length_18757_cov_4.427699_13_plen_74_part_00